MAGGKYTPVLRAGGGRFIPGVEADDGVLNVLADLVRGLEAEEVEVAEEVVVERQELQVKLQPGLAWERLQQRLEGGGARWVWPPKASI